jgi:hypothetical protein
MTTEVENKELESGVSIVEQLHKLPGSFCAGPISLLSFSSSLQVIASDFAWHTSPELLATTTSGMETNRL